MSDRFDFAPLRGRFTTMSNLAELVGVTRETVQRWARDGVPAKQVDAVAIAVGSHPVELWPEWERPLSQMYPDCGSRATAVRHRRNGEVPAGVALIEVCEVCGLAEQEHERRKYHRRRQDPEWVERERARNRARMRRTRAARRERTNP